MRLTNNSGDAVTWEGYPNTPWYRLRQRDLFGWYELDPGWFCGKGLETRRLAPRQSTEFNVDLPGWDPRRVQVGLDYSTSGARHCAVWSAPFRPWR